MPNREKTVFISYRREKGFYEAMAIFKALRAHDYDVFWDIESIDSGTFETIILNQIAARAHFLVVLTPGTLERTSQEGDWLRREIEHAIELKRNIVPVLMKGFNFRNESQYCTGKLAQLPRFNGLNIPVGYFDEAMLKLKTRFLKKPVQGSIVPAPESDRQVVEEKIQKAVESNPETIPPPVETDETEPAVGEQIKKNVSETFDASGIPQLETKLTPKPDPADADTEVTWTLAIHNKGNVPVKNLTIVHGRTILDDVDALPKGTTHELTFTISYSTVGDHTEIVRLFGAKVHRKVSGTVEVQKPPHLLLELATVSETVEMKKQIPWSLTIVNDGGMDLNHVMLQRGRTLLDDPFDLTIGKERQFSFKKSYHDVGEHTEKVTATAMTEAGERLRWMTEADVKVGSAKVTLTTPIEMTLIHIPAGEFLMRSDGDVEQDAQSNEQPQHRLHLPEYYIGKTPVTNAQYWVFVQDTGHEAPSHWMNGNIPSGKENHPVVLVSWHDAVAFCTWLSEQTGKRFRLPSEAEWEKAARGTEGWIYPWGNQWDPSRCNTEESGILDTTPIGKYSPQGDSPYGCVDMAGNVWEWTRSLDKAYPYKPDDGRENLDTDVLRVLRGGSCSNASRNVRCAYRLGLDPNRRDLNLGFRVVVSPSGP